MRNKVLATLATGVAIASLSMGTALAWTYGLSGVGNCQSDGSYKIVWTVDNTTENEPLLITASSNSNVVASDAQIPAQQTENFSQTVDGTKPGNFSLTLTGHYQDDQTNLIRTATVNLGEACSQPVPPAPTYTCNLLTVTAGDYRTVTISALNTSVTNGAVFKNAVVNWGDNSTPLTANNVVGQTHQYAQDGTYTIAAVAHFNVNGKDVTAGGAACTTQVTFTSSQLPSVTPPATTTPTAAPTQLVNTGPGSLVGIFAAVTAAGAATYHYLLRRKLSRQ